MATLNIGIKVNNAISATTTTNGATLYTAPSNGYAIINLYLTTNNANSHFSQVSVGGQPVASNYAVNSANGTSQGSTTQSITNSAYANSMSLTVLGIYVGPGQSVTFQGSGATSRASISGVEFRNTQ